MQGPVSKHSIALQILLVRLAADDPSGRVLPALPYVQRCTRYRGEKIVERRSEIGNFGDLIRDEWGINPGIPAFGFEQTDEPAADDAVGVDDVLASELGTSHHQGVEPALDQDAARGIPGGHDQ